MATNGLYLSADEDVLLSVRTHIKRLFIPALILLLLSAGLGVVLALIPASWPSWVAWVVGLVYLLALLVWVCWPFLIWFTTTYTITNRRIITRSGIINKQGHDLPLRRISDVRYDKDVIDRIFGCGTLILETAAENPLTLDDVPQVEQTQLLISQQLFGDISREGK